MEVEPSGNIYFNSKPKYNKNNNDFRAGTSNMTPSSFQSRYQPIGTRNMFPQQQPIFGQKYDVNNQSQFAPPENMLPYQMTPQQIQANRMPQNPMFPPNLQPQQMPPLQPQQMPPLQQQQMLHQLPQSQPILFQQTQPQQIQPHLQFPPQQQMNNLPFPTMQNQFGSPGFYQNYFPHNAMLNNNNNIHK